MILRGRDFVIEFVFVEYISFRIFFTFFMLYVGMYVGRVDNFVCILFFVFNKEIL